ncbi:Uncharacterised protein [Salmonella enterica subsp. enterica serovar Typhi]|nr:Uncharacterised protein [Salmonella enterica subsp. enterica serovar Typhi]
MAATISACRASAAAKAPLKASGGIFYHGAPRRNIQRAGVLTEQRTTGAKGNDDFFHPGLQNNISGFFASLISVMVTPDKKEASVSFGVMMSISDNKCVTCFV